MPFFANGTGTGLGEKNPHEYTLKHQTLEYEVSHSDIELSFRSLASSRYQWIKLVGFFKREYWTQQHAQQYIKRELLLLSSVWKKEKGKDVGKREGAEV
ncbi:hypothetical protein K2Q16_03870 [Patescibacteria group bacterium]|nr:hypothetical protein [Patescibacteria group bacterium]